MSEIKTYTDENFVTRRKGEESDEDTQARMETENRLREEARAEAGYALPSAFDGPLHKDA